MSLIIFIGSLYIIIGFVSLFIAIMFIELGRPKDLVQSGLIIFLGAFLIIYKNIFTFKISFILTLNAVLLYFYFVENLLYRWNQLLEKEKHNIKSFSGFNKNLSVIYGILSVDFKNIIFNNKLKSIFKNNSNKKKWVREKENQSTANLKDSSLKDSLKNIQTTDFSKGDIINKEKINTNKSKIDK